MVLPSATRRSYNRKRRPIASAVKRAAVMVLFGSPAVRVGPVAFRPRITLPRFRSGSLLLVDEGKDGCGVIGSGTLTFSLSTSTLPDRQPERQGYGLISFSQLRVDGCLAHQVSYDSTLS